MPTKRRKLPPRRINDPVPHWAARLLTGELPGRDGDDWEEFVSWKFFGDPVPGLPDPMSAEGRALWAVRDAD
jgi:hypothetical protein